MEFASEIHHADDDELARVAARWVDVDEALRYLAVDDAISNRDGITAFYCYPRDSCGNHNFYAYEDARHRFFFLPWDVGGTFDIANDRQGVPAWNDEVSDCDYRYFGDMQAPGCDLLIRALALSDQKPYRDALIELAAGPFQISKLHEYIDTLTRLIAPEVETDRFGPSVEYWKNSVAVLKRDLTFFHERIDALRKDDDPLNARLTVDKVNDWESVGSSAAILGLQRFSPPSTSLTHRLSKDNPLRGTRDLRVDFVFRNGEQSWDIWGALRLPFADAPVDLGIISTIQLRMHSDRLRTVNISLDSEQYTKKDEGIMYGWDVEIGPTPAIITLSLDTLSIPEWASPVPETPALIRASSAALRISPYAVGVLDTGFFSPGVTDTGFVQIDEIRFIP
ncbi:MAG: CotH kinase family protein [Parcubacteria group bacterium]|nr:CotH kinase family protein [Parcubacteria group bacterium]